MRIWIQLWLGNCVWHTCLSAGDQAGLVPGDYFYVDNNLELRVRFRFYLSGFGGNAPGTMSPERKANEMYSLSINLSKDLRPNTSSRDTCVFWINYLPRGQSGLNTQLQSLLEKEQNHSFDRYKQLQKRWHRPGDVRYG